jgi:hypothetical protein
MKLITQRNEIQRCAKCGTDDFKPHPKGDGDAFVCANCNEPQLHFNSTGWFKKISDEGEK